MAISGNVRITDPIDQADSDSEDAMCGQETPAVLAKPSPTLIPDLGTSAGEHFKGTEEYRDITIEEGNGSGSGSGFIRDSNNVSPHQQVNVLTAHAHDQDNDLQLAAEFSSIECVPPPTLTLNLWEP